MVCLRRPYSYNFFKGCPPQILLGPLLNTLSHLEILRQKKAAHTNNIDEKEVARK